jgi:translation initiation factor 2B subunit (eIF-2B alpha/beta/delta family)
MAEFKATAQLNIETLTDKAQSDILALSELMNRKLNPGESGEFSPTQDAALEQGVQQRAAALTAATGKEVTPEKVRQTLQEISRLEEEIKNKMDARDLTQQKLNEKLAKAKEEEQAINDYKNKGNELLGMQAAT